MSLECTGNHSVICRDIKSLVILEFSLKVCALPFRLDDSVSFIVDIADPSPEGDSYQNTVTFIKLGRKEDCLRFASASHLAS